MGDGVKELVIFITLVVCFSVNFEAELVLDSFVLILEVVAVAADLEA